MSRFARSHRVFYFEEPVFEEGGPSLQINSCPRTHIQVCTPVLPPGLTAAAIVQQQRDLLDAFLVEKGVVKYLSWYYTPMAREFSRHLEPVVVVYDCMDELSAFSAAPPTMLQNEQELFEAAALVFTGGASLFEAKRKQHACVYLFPSSVDTAHFAAGRSPQPEPQDQAAVPHPRIGYAGVIDERMDLNFLSEVAARRPEWHLVLLGPVTKIDPATLPQAPNLHYFGMKSYAELPAYLSGWKIGMLPFARNESTRYISPTKTPEYLAAGLHVISTPIQDVVKPYGELGLVGIAEDADSFVELAEDLLRRPPTKSHLERVDTYLSFNSWDKTWREMSERIAEAIEKKSELQEKGISRDMTSTVSIKGPAHV
jgi:Glycosyl transferases group 1